MSGAFSKSSSKASSFIDPAQAPFLASLRSQALGLQQGQAGAGVGGQEFFDQALQPLQQQGQQALQGLGGLVSGDNPFLQQLAQRAEQGNPFLDQVISQTQGDIGRNFQENILPAIGGAAAGLGQRGGARQGVAEGIAARDAQRLGADAATNLRFQGFGQQGNDLRSILANQQGALSQTFPALGGQFGLSTAQVSAPFLGLQQLQGLLGDPSILNQSKSSSFSISGGIG